MTKRPTLTDIASARALVDHISERLQAAAIVDFRLPPPEPTACCGRGCNGCVWEGYFCALSWWRDNAMDLLRSPAT